MMMISNQTLGSFSGLSPNHIRQLGLKHGQILKFLISVAYFISSVLFQLYIFVLVYLEKISFAHFIIYALMEQIEL